MSRPKIPKEKEEKVVEMLLAGATPYRIQKELGVVKSTITRIMWEHGMQSKAVKGDEKYNQAKKELKFSKKIAERLGLDNDDAIKIAERRRKWKQSSEL